jgi:hypothetical protein
MEQADLERVRAENAQMCQQLADATATGKYPPAEPGALGMGPLEAAEGVADAAPRLWAT